MAEVVILLLGLTARFAFDRPLVWSDELASIVFLWLAMFGSAAALRRGSHMRLTTLGILYVLVAAVPWISVGFL